MNDRSYLAGQRIFRLWIDPYNGWCSGLNVFPTHNNFTQPVIMLEEVAAVAKLMALHHSNVIVLGTLLHAEHHSAEVVLRQLQRLHTLPTSSIRPARCSPPTRLVIALPGGSLSSTCPLLSTVLTRHAPGCFVLAHALAVVAREYGFSSWPQLVLS